ncbi:abhydrolase domain-containing protein 11 [Nannizzia gypsea CBS 118893]|uniref:Abhydrolase domain-containing protein 11 n=1 Tax=Arthroderma gypseum (strain ATCC MYA-4604 / CBS 118893) TaxID=535722 RepID=E4UV28_ARTGP|nr:abhydrolase domain-containing protein 11 [Nannizzia gypsea CBS 118893]EFR01145.1 abhydrolase domain-containing protein 11 [Nannizzia gypsea CBS 118893]
MFARRRLLISVKAVRHFAASARSSLGLAHQVFENPQAAGTNGRPIIFMHGLFGSKQNNRGMSKVLASQLGTSVYAIDLRNHGDSPHVPEHNYDVMADDVESFIKDRNLEKPVLLGHSMGAKAAMHLALRAPDLISAIISVDNSPTKTKLSENFPAYIKTMQEIENAGVTKQSEADEILRRVEPSLPVRQFLLTNLARDQNGQTLRFRIPLSILGESLPLLGDFPFTQSDAVQFSGPALFLRGTRSRYITDKSFPIIRHFFPNYKLMDIDAGHWLISENPDAFKTGMSNP